MRVARWTIWRRSAQWNCNCHQKIRPKLRPASSKTPAQMLRYFDSVGRGIRHGLLSMLSLIEIVHRFSCHRPVHQQVLDGEVRHAGQWRVQCSQHSEILPQRRLTRASCRQNWPVQNIQRWTMWKRCKVRRAVAQTMSGGQLTCRRSKRFYGPSLHLTRNERLKFSVCLILIFLEPCTATAAATTTIYALTFIPASCHWNCTISVMC